MTFSVDLKHLSWLSVVGDDRQKLMRSPTKKEINENFQGTRVVENVFSGYYQFNKKKNSFGPTKMWLKVPLKLILKLVLK